MINYEELIKIKPGMWIKTHKQEDIIDEYAFFRSIPMYDKWLQVQHFDVRNQLSKSSPNYYQIETADGWFTRNQIEIVCTQEEMEKNYPEYLI